MDIERQFIDYLKFYGNTKESDLIEYGARISNQSRKNTKSLLDKMVFEGKAQRVVHSKIGPNAVYITREGCVLHELAMGIEKDARDIKNRRNFSAEEERILREAATLAEKRIREKYPEQNK